MLPLTLNYLRGPGSHPSSTAVMRLQTKADAERRLAAVESRLAAAASKERELEQRQAALLEKVGLQHTGGCLLAW